MVVQPARRPQQQQKNKRPVPAIAMLQFLGRPRDQVDYTNRSRSIGEMPVLFDRAAHFLLKLTFRS
jgi:hypothetical protein